MFCPLCKGDTIVVDSRHTTIDNIIRRRRQCLKCGHKFSTKEILTSTYDPIYRTLISYDGGKNWIDKPDKVNKLTKTIVSYDNGASWQEEPNERRKYGKNRS